MPIRGASSISRTPRSRNRASAVSISATRYATWWSPGPALREEPADRRVVRERAQQLDMALADVEQHRLDALLGHGLAMDDRHAVRPLVQRERGIQVRDGDADVVDPLKHLR